MADDQKAPQATVRPEPADDLVEATAAGEEFLGLGDEDAQLWMQVAKRLAIDNAQTQLHDRELKTEVRHTAIVKIAAAYLADTTVPEVRRTIQWAIYYVMKAFGARDQIKKSKRIWTGGEVAVRTVQYVLDEAQREGLLIRYFQLFVLRFELRTGLSVARACRARLLDKGANHDETERLAHLLWLLEPPQYVDCCNEIESLRKKI